MRNHIILFLCKGAAAVSFVVNLLATVIKIFSPLWSEAHTVSWRIQDSSGIEVIMWVVILIYLERRD